MSRKLHAYKISHKRWNLQSTTENSWWSSVPIKVTNKMRPTKDREVYQKRSEIGYSMVVKDHNIFLHEKNHRMYVFIKTFWNCSFILRRLNASNSNNINEKESDHWKSIENLLKILYYGLSYNQPVNRWMLKPLASEYLKYEEQSTNYENEHSPRHQKMQFEFDYVCRRQFSPSLTSYFD